MKQVKHSVLFSVMLCVLIGYFEPANAAKIMKASEPTVAYVALNSTVNYCPFWPNPVAPGASITAIAIGKPTGGFLVSISGDNKYSVTIGSYGQPWPLGVVENNQYFVPDQIDSLSGTTLTMPVVPTGDYYLTVNCANGNAYTSKVTFTK
jgi:hypothetical protein